MWEKKSLGGCMKKGGSNRCFAHRSKIWWFRISAFGAGHVVYTFLTEPAEVVPSIPFFLVYLILDIVIMSVKYIRGKFARVSFNLEGLTYYKYFKKRFIPWEHVTVIKEDYPFIRHIRYYRITVENEIGVTEYLIEKNIRTRALIEKYYIRDIHIDKLIRMPTLMIQIHSLIIESIVFAYGIVLLLYIMGDQDILPKGLLINIGILSAIIGGLCIAGFIYFKRKDRLTIDECGIKLNIHEKYYEVKWKDAVRITHKVEHLSKSNTNVISLDLIHALDGEYETIAVYASKAEYNNIKSYTSVIEENVPEYF
jgi:hypothetical protein